MVAYISSSSCKEAVNVHETPYHDPDDDGRDGPAGREERGPRAAVGSCWADMENAEEAEGMDDTQKIPALPPFIWGCPTLAETPVPL